MNGHTAADPKRKATFDLDIPLDTGTDSATDVSQLVRGLLDHIGLFDGRASHADILQALGIVATVRTAIARAAAEPGTDFSLKLLDIDVRDPVT